MVDERHSLLIGSGPGIDAWWPAHRRYFLDNSYRIHPINNAVSVVGADTTVWYKSWDYTGFIPDEIPPTFPDPSEQWLMRPLWHPPPPGLSGYVPCVMFHAALYHMLNEAIRDAVSASVVVIGCDLIYDGKQTHFYGTGTPDPLRFGGAWLDTELARLTAVYPSAYSTLRNASTTESRLPFDRFTDHLSAREVGSEYAS
jgi:hypothetical protein